MSRQMHGRRPGAAERRAIAELGQIRTSTAWPKSFFVARAVLAIEAPELPDTHPVITVKNKLGIGDHPLGVVLLDKNRGKRVRPELLLDPAKHERTLEKAIAGFPKVLHGSLGEAGIYGNLKQSSSTKYVGYTFNPELAHELTRQAGVLIEAVGLDCEPGEPHLNVYATRNRYLAQEMEHRLNQESVAVEIQLGAAYPQPFELPS